MGNRVVVVTGGGGGIGSAGALELARQGAAVIVLDAGVGVTGEPLGEPVAEETAKRIEAAGGTARISTISVTDAEAVRALFAEVVDEFGSLDAVVNAAGVLRFPRLADTSEDDWRTVLDVHFNGYLNVLAAALPLMGAAGYGRIVGCTSGVGLARTSVDGPAYGSAKRAVASLTWKLGNVAPSGVTVNALSPIAATRMVREGLIAAGVSPKGLDLTAMPQGEDMGPAVAFLASDRFGWSSGRVLFSAGSELSLIEPPRLIEAVRTEGVGDLATSLDTLVPVVLGPAESGQRTSGGSNPRFGNVWNLPAPYGPRGPLGDPTTGACLVVSDDPEIARLLGAALTHWGKRTAGVGPWQPFDRAATEVPTGFDEALNTLERASGVAGPIDAVVVILTPHTATHSAGTPAWQQLVESHRGTAHDVIAQAAWARAAARHAATTGQNVRAVHVVPARTPAAQTVAQAVTQFVRSVPEGTGLAAFSITLESHNDNDRSPLADLAARLVCAKDASVLVGAELVVARGWLGVRSHPGPATTVSFGGPAIPAWVDASLREAAGTP
jgi:NAD(P)-dependent dehydrogenase (short-subunit alcohol dehydrogenase family)